MIKEEDGGGAKSDRAINLLESGNSGGNAYTPPSLAAFREIDVALKELSSRIFAFQESIKPLSCDEKETKRRRRRRGRERHSGERESVTIHQDLFKLFNGIFPFTAQ